MNRETLLAGGVAVVILASVFAAALVPGAIAQSREEVVRPGPVEVAEMTIAPGPVSGASATLSVDTRLTHRGNPTENVTLQLRAVDLEAGMVEATRTIEVETIRGEREVSVPGDLTVPREGGYRIEAILYRDGQRIDEGAKEVQGVESLIPAYAETAVKFHRFGGDLPAVEYAIEEVDDDQATLDVSSYLTNKGDESAGDLQLTLIARQADSNIVTDRTTVDVGDIRPGRTAAPSASLTVPDGYNYYLDAVLWKDDVIVGTERAAANLDPSETLHVNETTREVSLEVSDFESGQNRGVATEEPTETVQAADGQPGFGVVVALVALLGTIALYRRQHA